MDLQGTNLSLQNNGVSSSSVSQPFNNVNLDQRKLVSSNNSIPERVTSVNNSSSTSVVTQLVSGSQASAAVYSSLVNQSENISQVDLSQANRTALNNTSLSDNQRNNNDQALAQAELEVVQQLASRDREVRAHEQTHAAIGGIHAGSPMFEFENGPDGQLYATSGHVSIDTSPVENDPRATLEKAQIIIRAALSVSEPSSADRQVASEAKSLALQAITDLTSDQQVNNNQRTSVQDETARVEEEQLKSDEFRAEEDLKQVRSERERALAESRKQSTEASIEVLKEFNVEIHEIQETLRRLNTQLVDSGAFGKVFPEGALIDQNV